MRKILFALIGCFVAICAHAAQVVNVDYVHKLIAQKWDISVPIKTNNIMAVANMKYLLTAVDVANEILNGEKTTDYGNGEFATLQVADTVATIQAVDTLVKQNKIEYKFFMDIDLSQYGDNDLGFATVTEFGFDISAAGTFYIDWGDGTTETIKKADTNPVTYSHDYGTATGVFRVGIGGRATDYSDDTYTSVLGFSEQPGPMSELREAITNIDGSLGAIFGTLADGSQPSFCYMFDSTQGVKKIPDNLFKGIHGDLVDGMFQGTFSYCYSLTGPSARIDGLYLYEIWPDATEEQVGGMYTESSGLSDYECIPVAWGGLGVEDCSLPYEFYLETEYIDSFSFNISAAGEFIVNWGDGTVETITKADTTDTTYSHTYSSSKSYTIKLAGQATAYNTDENTAAISFHSSASKIASIDGSLGAIFGTLSSDTNNQPRFYKTFYNATNMTGSIPSDLFAGISGAPASYMFYYTFRGCSGLTSIPSDLFAGISGAPATNMFNNTFSGCSGLTSIPENLFGNISGTAQNGMFYYMFSYCTSLTGPSARINGKYLYEIWPSATSSQVGDMYYKATGLDDYRCIPTTWGGGGEYCSAPTAEFTLTTTPDTNSFSFKISAAGTFYIDWGDGTTEIVTKTDTKDTTYSHTYSTAGAYTIGIGGQATAYNASIYTAAISFYVNSSQTEIASIDGSLGAIFGTLTRGANNQPLFYQTFYNATNMTGSIPSDLFAGISGAPASDMFQDTFYGCSGLTSIPSDLFAGISGAPARYMFSGTFSGCSGLTSIPSDLFAGISGAPARYMFQNTFDGCSGLTGAIPDGLFGNLTGAPAERMFDSTFYGCSKLTSIPENLFGNISGTAQNYMFYYTFSNCTSLTGPSARINGQYLYEIWPDATSIQVNDMYYNATGLSDYSSIPSAWK